MRGDDLQMAVEIDFKSAVFGTTQEIQIDRQKSCETCGGSRMKPGTGKKTCTACRGQGVVVSQVMTPFGVMQSQRECGTCRGQGQVIDQYCTACSGQGRISEKKPVQVKIPCGIADGMKLRIAGSGDAGNKGGPPGDLYLVLRVKRDPKFNRDGTTIETDTEVDFTQAILGCTVQIDTVEGSPVKMKIPEGTQPGTKLRLRGKGIPELNKPDNRGDHIVTVKVTIPKKLSDKERSVVEELQAMKVGQLSSLAPSSNLVHYIYPSLSLSALFMLGLVSFKQFSRFHQSYRGPREPLMEA